MKIGGCLTSSFRLASPLQDAVKFEQVPWILFIVDAENKSRSFPTVQGEKDLYRIMDITIVLEKQDLLVAGRKPK